MRYARTNASYTLQTWRDLALKLTRIGDGGLIGRYWVTPVKVIVRF